MLHFSCKPKVSSLTQVALIAAAALVSGSALAAVDYRDTLERAFAGPDDSQLASDRNYDVFVADQWTYDDDVFRLPSNTENLATLIGPNASRGDNINSATAGLEGQWTSGRQRVNLNLRVDDNRFLRNTDLNNVSSSDKLTWDWALGSPLSGQLGAYFYRSLAGFVNSDVYTRNVIDQEGAYGTARYQIGPHWAIFAGLLGANTDLTAAVSRVNDNSSKIFDFGTEFAMSPTNNVGLEYRFNDVNFPHEDVFFGLPGNGNYREDLARFIFNYALSEKTLIVSNVGYLKRNYTGSAIHDFGGDIWRVSVRWQPTDKTNIAVDGWRKLQAYLTEQSAYFVSNGGSVGPTFTTSEKLNFVLLASVEEQNYLGTGQTEVVIVPVNAQQTFTGPRHDRVDAAQAEMIYNPIASIALHFTYRYENRKSNEEQFQYDDRIASISATWRF